jgi:hypothetical protein
MVVDVQPYCPMCDAPLAVYPHFDHEQKEATVLECRRCQFKAEITATYREFDRAYTQYAYLADRFPGHP